MIFFTSDTHFGHTNIIKYCNRPFSSVTDMDDFMIKAWNKKVSKNDTVYHLGDFTFGDPTRYIYSLNFKNFFLVPGNHDNLKRWISVVGDNIQVLPEMVTIKTEGQSIVLCHYAMEVWNKSHYRRWHLHGHSHGNLPSRGLRLDVGVDCTSDYTPLSFNEVKELISKKTIEKVDHHE